MVHADLEEFIFANNTYSKPYFVTYVNTAFFAIALIPIAIKRIYQNGVTVLVPIEYSQVPAEEDCLYSKPNAEEHPPRRSRSPTSRLLCEDEMGRPEDLDKHLETPKEDPLTAWETVKLSLEFCILWVSNE